MKFCVRRSNFVGWSNLHTYRTYLAFRTKLTFFLKGFIQTFLHSEITRMRSTANWLFEIFAYKKIDMFIFLQNLLTFADFNQKFIFSTISQNLRVLVQNFKHNYPKNYYSRKGNFWINAPSWKVSFHTNLIIVKMKI